MKRTVIFALIAVLAFTSVLVACAGKDGDGSDTSAKTTEVSAETGGSSDASTDAQSVDPFDGVETLAPGVSWSDLVPVTDTADDSVTNVDPDAGAGTETQTDTETTVHYIESGIELPIIPLYP